MMIKNYLRIALRALNKQKRYTLINLLGLATGLACVIFIYLFVQDELSYDRFNEKGERIYRVAGIYDQGGDALNHSAITTYKLRDMLLTRIPAIQNVVRLGPAGNSFKHNGKFYEEKRVLAADQGFFDMFSYRFVDGEPETALDGPNKMVITQAMARKYFGDRKAVGQALEFDDEMVAITGVIAEMPRTSHFHADFIISMQTMHPKYPEWVRSNATGSSHHTYIELPPGMSVAEFETAAEEMLVSMSPEFAEQVSYFLQPLYGIHLHSNLTNELEPNGDIKNVYILAIVAFIILLTACINYTNLAIARSAGRAREVGMRKVLGAQKRQLIYQFIGESVLLAVLALFLAGLLVELLMPWFVQLSGKELEFTLLGNFSFWGSLFLLAVAVGVLAGGYPAFFLSSYRAVRVLKGTTAENGHKPIILRKGLLVLQFTLSVILIICTATVYSQLEFLQNRKLGINPEQLMQIPFQSREMISNYEQIRTALLAQPGAVSVSANAGTLTSRIGNWRQYYLNGSEEQVQIPTMVVEHGFFETVQAEIISGRDFSKAFSTDVSGAYIINESAARFLGLEPEAAVGTPIVGSIFTGSVWGRKNAKIIGVVKDFHLASLHTEIQPAIFSLHSGRTTGLSQLIVRVRADHLQNTVQGIEKVCGAFSDGRAINFTFMDEDVQLLYQAEQRFLEIFSTFTFLAILVTCLGVLGLSAFTAMQRTKEIGIRKVLGAPVFRIVALLSTDFVKMVLLANIIAWPVAYFAMSTWLTSFAYRTELGIWLFLFSGLLALVIALATISFQSISAALVNPVKSLRYE